MQGNQRLEVLSAASISLTIYVTNKITKEFSIIEIRQSTNYNCDAGIMTNTLTEYSSNVIQKIRKLAIFAKKHAQRMFVLHTAFVAIR
jgi:hypothetical protein